MSRTARDMSIDLAKAIGILLVVFGHSMEVFFSSDVSGMEPVAGAHPYYTAWKFIYSFHMPLFYFLSGVMMEPPKEGAWRKMAVSALTLYIVFSLLQLVGGPLRFAFPMHNDDPFPGYLAAGLSTLWPLVSFESQSLAVMWFLPSLAVARFICLANIALPRRTVVVLDLLVLAVFVAFMHFNLFYFQIETAVIGAVFCGLGYLYTSRQFREGLARFALPVAVVAMGIVAATFSLNQGCAWPATDVCPDGGFGEFAVIMVGARYGFFPLFFLTAIAGITGVMAIALLIEKLGRTAWLARIGEASLNLLIVNGVFYVFAGPVAARYVLGWNILLFAVLFTGLQVLVARLLEKQLSGYFAFSKKIATRWVDAICARGVKQA